MAATTTVTVTVSDVNEPAEITGDALINVVENGIGSVADYSASQPQVGTVLRAYRPARLMFVGSPRDASPC